MAIAGSGTTNNAVSGNYIGTDVTGTVALGNLSHGVFILNGAQSNTIGGTTAGDRNIISGNNSDSMGITDPGTDNNVVSGNFIGTDVTGTAALGNSVWDIGIVSIESVLPGYSASAIISEVSGNTTRAS